MSPSVLPLAQEYSRLTRGTPLTWQTLLSRPDTRRGWVDMASLDSIVTDSSAAASSWGSGSRIFNSWVNMLPDGTRLTPICDVARGAGLRTGLVTTATVTHATPAGFAAVEKSRDNEAGIAEQYLDKIDVILGGGEKFFSAKTRKDKRDMAAEFGKHGYALATNAAELEKISSARMLGLFSASHMPYVIDVRNQPKQYSGVPALAAMARKALGALSGAPKGFLLQIEGGRVDHAAHANDIAAQMQEQIAFDEAIDVVLAFCAKNPDTLVFITSDHGNSNPGLIGMGYEYVDSNEYFARIQGVRASFYDLAPKLGLTAEYTMANGKKVIARSTPLTLGKIREIAEAALGFALTDDEAVKLQRYAAGDRELDLNTQHDAAVGLLGEAVGNHVGVQWTGTTHTSDYTLYTALGPGSELFSGLIRNTDVFPALTGLLGAAFRNPTMTPEQARKFYAAHKETAALRRLSAQPHWV
jgi:alkaline phosphatase